MSMEHALGQAENTSSRVRYRIERCTCMNEWSLVEFVWRLEAKEK